MDIFKKAKERIVILLVVGLLLGATAMLVSWGCNSQYAARKMGGTATITLPHGTKLVNITWKESSLWYLTRQRRKDEPIDSYVFQEDSVFGLMGGTVNIKEQE